VPVLTATGGVRRSREQVLVLSIGGDLSQGVVLPALYSDAAPQPDADPNRHVVVYGDGMRIVHEPGRLVLDGWDAEARWRSAPGMSSLKPATAGSSTSTMPGWRRGPPHKGGNQFEVEKWVAGSVVIDKGDQGFHPPEVEA
jgi:hypothetical protein